MSAPLRPLALAALAVCVSSFLTDCSPTTGEIPYRVRTIDAPTGALAAEPSDRQDARDAVELELEVSGDELDGARVAIEVTPPDGVPFSLTYDVDIEALRASTDGVELTAGADPMDIVARHDLGRLLIGLHGLPRLTAPSDETRVHIEIATAEVGCNPGRLSALDHVVAGPAERPFEREVAHRLRPTEGAEPAPHTECVQEWLWAYDRLASTHPRLTDALRHAWEHHRRAGRLGAARWYAHALLRDLRWALHNTGDTSAVTAPEPTEVAAEILDVLKRQLHAESDAAPTDAADHSIFPVAMDLLEPGIRAGREWALMRAARFGLIRLANLRQIVKTTIEVADRQSLFAIGAEVAASIEAWTGEVDPGCTRHTWARIRGWMHYNAADLAMDAGDLGRATERIDKASACFEGHIRAAEGDAELDSKARNLRANTLRMRAQIALAGGDAATALREAERSLDLAERDFARRYGRAVAARAAADLSRWSVAYEHAAEAVELLQQALRNEARAVGREALLRKPLHRMALEVYFDAASRGLGHDLDTVLALESLRASSTPGVGGAAGANKADLATIESVLRRFADSSEAADLACAENAPSDETSRGDMRLAAGQAVAVMAPVGPAVFVAVWSASGATSIRLPVPPEALTAQIESALETLRSGEPDVSPLRTLAQTLRPIVDALAPLDVDTPLVAAWGPWHRIPWHALERADALNVSTTPSLSWALRESAPTKGAAPVAGPTLRRAMTLIADDRESFVSPASVEVESLRRAAGPDCELRTASRLEDLGRESTDALFVRGHGSRVTPAGRSGKTIQFDPHATQSTPAICLARCQEEHPEWMTLGDIRRLESVHRWVLLSVCSAASGQAMPLSGAVTSLPHAFLERGTLQVVAPLWPVQEIHAREWMHDVTQELNLSGDLCQANRRVARKWKKRGETSDRWAAFVCSGRAASFSTGGRIGDRE